MSPPKRCTYLQPSLLAHTAPLSFSSLAVTLSYPPRDHLAGECGRALPGLDPLRAPQAANWLWTPGGEVVYDG